MFVSRYTFNPQYDVERNWTGWIGRSWDSLSEAAEELVDTEELETAWEKWQDGGWQTWYYRDTEDYDEFCEYILAENGERVEFHKVFGKYLLYHHDGLACWPLRAETAKAAVAEAQTNPGEWHGFGDQTIGNVRYVCAVPGIEHLHIFECDDTMPES